MANKTKEPTVKVETVFIDSIGYNPFKKTIVIKLTSGDIETFYNNSLEDYEEFYNSEDKDNQLLDVLQPKRQKAKDKSWGIAEESNR